MYILYLDESGNPEDWTQNRCFVLAGAAVFEGEIRKLTDDVEGFQDTYLPHVSVPIELHAGDIYKGKKRWRDETKEFRTNLMRTIYHTIRNQNYPWLVLFGAVVHESVPEPGSSDVLRWAFEEICGRFNQFLARQAQGFTPQKGLLILDQSGREKRYRELADSFQSDGVRLGYLGNIVDIPYFTGSQHTRMLQIADFVAYALFQYYENNSSEFLDMIGGRFDRPNRAAGGHPVGLSHLTRNPAGSNCGCPATHGKLGS